MIDRESRLMFRRGGVIDLDNDLVKLRPLSFSLPLPFLGGDLENERLRSIARVLEGDLDREPDLEEPV